MNKRCIGCGLPKAQCKCRVQVCANCGKEYKQSPQEELYLRIMKREPACSPECRAVLNPKG